MESCDNVCIWGFAFIYVIFYFLFFLAEPSCWSFAFNSLTSEAHTIQKKIGSVFFSILYIRDRLPTGLPLLEGIGI